MNWIKNYWKVVGGADGHTRTHTQNPVFAYKIRKIAESAEYCSLSCRLKKPFSFVTVLLTVFSYLDDMSLWSVGNVCKRWRHLLRSHVAAEQWRIYTMQRWPLFKPLCSVQDWFKVYTEL
jgi:hypothetical protein